MQEKNTRNDDTTKSRNIIIIQPALPAYRIDFFERVAKKLCEQFTVYYSRTNLGVLTSEDRTYTWAKPIGPIKPLFRGVEWQSNVLSIPIRRGDLIIVSGAPRCLSNLILLTYARLRGAKTVWWGHLWSGTSKKYRFLLRLMLMKMAHALLFYTDAEINAYRSRYGQKDSRLITALNNGINIDQIKVLRTEYAEHARKNKLLFIGRVTDKAELHLLLHALEKPECGLMVLHIIGDGPKKPELIDLANRLKITNRIFWHAATTDETKIAAIANQCGAFVYPGGVGLSLIHAMAYGLPAIVHDDRLTHMPEIDAFQQSETGVTFHKGDIDSLAKTIEKISSQSGLIAMSYKSIERIENFFNTEKMAERLLQMVEKLN